MRVLNLRNAALALVAGLGLGGCAYGPYGGLGVGVGYGNNGYYGNSGYYGGYGSYGYSPYGYNAGYGYSPYGWYDGFYYPGRGYYVYDRHRRPHRWTDAQRRYWERQRGIATSSGGVSRVIENWADFQNGAQASNNVVRQRVVNNRVVRSTPVVRERRVQTAMEQERRAARSEARAEARQERRERRNRRVNKD